MGTSTHCDFGTWYSGNNASGQRNVSFTTLLSWEEFALARMLGIFGHINYHEGGYQANIYPEIARDLDFVVEIITDDKPRLKTVSLKKDKANTKHCTIATT